MKERSYQQHIQVAMAYFIMAALLGILLRSYPIFSFGFHYRYVVHAHSHIALLGWVYVAMTTLLHYCFVEKDTSGKRYRRIFGATQVTLIGMLLTFPFQGYALFSIIFSTLFLVVSYVFFYHFSKHVRPKFRDSKALVCMKAALWYMVISSLGPWALGVIMTTLGAQSIWYRSAIYFYLHFQYNGWMVLTLIGLFLFALEQRGFVFPKKRFVPFFWALNMGIVLSFFLSTLWTKPSTWIYLAAGLGALAQLYAIVLLWIKTGNVFITLSLSKMQDHLIKTVVVLLGIKLILQVLTSFPYFSRMAVTYLDLTIGYLHLTFLGVISIGLFLFMDYFGLFRISRSAYRWYFLGFLLTETLIFYRGFIAWQHWTVPKGFIEILALVSILIPIGLCAMFLQNRKQP